MFALVLRFQELPLFTAGPQPVAGYFGQISGGSLDKCHLLSIQNRKFRFAAVTLMCHAKCYKILQ
jgi:hypothetical protein